MKFLSRIHNTLKGFETLEFLPLFLIRLYLFYVLWFAGINKIDSFDKFSGYLGTLGVPFPDIFTWLVIITEAGGAALILIGLSLGGLQFHFWLLCFLLDILSIGKTDGLMKQMVLNLLLFIH